MMLFQIISYELQMGRDYITITRVIHKMSTLGYSWIELHFHCMKIAVIDHTIDHEACLRILRYHKRGTL